MQFSDVIGHDELKSHLCATVQSGRISHAQLFLGPEGSGNLALALAYVQYLFCEMREPNDSCGSCSSCTRITNLVHPDLSFSFPVATKTNLALPKSIDFITEWREAITHNPYINYNEWMELVDLENKQGIIATPEANDILSRLSLTSVEGRYKVVIMWLPECMNASSANKLLKIIEEPGANTYFLLVGESYDQIIPTITSRCQLIKVNRLSENELIQALRQKHNLDHDAARHIAHRSSGSYNEALKIIRNDEADVNLNQWFLEWMRACYSGNISKIAELCLAFAGESREKQKAALYHALNITRECLLINYGDRSMIHFEGKELEDLSRFAPFLFIQNTESIVSELNDAIFHTERNASAKILFTDLSFRIQAILHRKQEVFS